MRPRAGSLWRRGGFRGAVASRVGVAAGITALAGIAGHAILQSPSTEIGLAPPALAAQAPPTQTAAGQAAPAEAPEPRVDSIFAEMDRPDHPGCALSVMRAGAPIYQRGYGMANLEYGIPITPASVFHVASVSKQFTAFAVVLLALEGELSLDDDVRDYVPEVPDFGMRITIRHLLHHTSGLRDQWDLLGLAGWRFESDVITKEDVLDITSRQRALNFPPGAEYLYSNTGYTLLGVIVERVSGQSLREFTTERIFRPLGMEATHFHDSHLMVVPNRAYAYAPMGEGRWRLSIPDFDVVGATSLFTTVSDLARWDHNFYTAQVGGPEAVELMHTQGRLNSGEEIPYAFALVHGSFQGLRTVSHSGSDAGYRSFFVRFPEQELSVAVLCAYPAGNPSGRAYRVAEVFLEDEIAPRASVEGEERGASPEPRDEAPGPAAIEVARSVLEGYVGIYRSPGRDEVIELRLDGEGLEIARGGRGGLVPVGEGRFRVRGSSREVVFYRDDEGSVRLLMDGRPSPRDPVRRDRVAPTRTDLEEYVGTYHSLDLGTDYTIHLGEEGLMLGHRKLGDRPLTPLDHDGFDARGRTITFFRDEGGGIGGFTLSTGRVRRVGFERTGGETRVPG